MARLITSIDLGTSTIRGAVCELDKKGEVKLLALDNISSSGISSGNISDFNLAKDAVIELMGRLEQKISRKIKYVNAAINGTDLDGFIANGLIGLSKKARQATKLDVEKCKDMASLAAIPIDRQIIQKEIHNFYINEGETVSDPVGLYATKLGVKLYMILAPQAKIMNLESCIERAGYVLGDMIFSGSAYMRSILEEEDKTTKVAIIDIGANITTMTFCKDNKMDYFKIVSKGTAEFNNITQMNSYINEIKHYLMKAKVSKVFITGGGALHTDILEMAEKAFQIKCELGRVRLKWCKLSPKEALLHATTLGVIACQKERIIPEANDATFFNRTIKAFNNILENYF